MTITMPPSARVTYHDIHDAALLPEDYQLPLEVMRLPHVSRTQLLHDPLRPVSHIEKSVYAAQRLMLQDWSEQSYCQHLRIYCAELVLLAPKAWAYLVQRGWPNYVCVKAVADRGSLSRNSADTIISLYPHWVELQNYARVPPSAMQPSTRGVQPTDEPQAQPPFIGDIW